MQGKVPPAGAIGGVAQSIVAGDQPPADIIVTAIKNSFKSGFEGVFDDLNKGLKSLFTDIFGERGIFSGSLSKTLGEAAGNAALGGTAGGLVTGLLGIKGSGTGGMLGGAIGGYLGKELLGGLGSMAGPLGSIAGGILGGVVGGLLKKTKTGAANITGVDSDPTLSGNSSQFKAAASGAAGSVQEGLASIAEQLGGAIGGFNVTIGQRHGDWRVRSGTGSLKVAKGAKEFDDDQQGAIAYAISLAVSQGAVTGLSTAVQKALASSPDLDKSLEEALKVSQVEQMLGGITGELTSQFKALEAQAKERLRIATQYGFDVVAIEKKNAEDRAKLVDEILSSRIGSLQSLLDDLKFGDLFEGSIADQRTALLAEIAKARGAAEAGEDGAADTLASLSRKLIELTREGYGTAGGEYTADRDQAITDAQAVIKSETDRIKAAQQAAGITNAKLDESNDIATDQADSLAEISTKLTALIAVVSGGGSAIRVDSDLVARGL